MYSIKLYVYIYVHVNVLFVVSLCYIDTNQNNQMKLKSSRLRQVSQSLNVHRNELVVTRTLIYLLILSERGAAAETSREVELLFSSHVCWLRSYFRNVSARERKIIWMFFTFKQLKSSVSFLNVFLSPCMFCFFFSKCKMCIKKTVTTTPASTISWRNSCRFVQLFDLAVNLFCCKWCFCYSVHLQRASGSSTHFVCDIPQHK